LEYKECPKCKKLLLHTDKFFRKKGISKCGHIKLRSHCRKCESKSCQIYQKNREKTDINFKIRQAYSCRIRRALHFTGRKKAMVTSKMLGCTIPELKNI
jgi:acetyl-CoA carboxylase beta subunit